MWKPCKCCGRKGSKGGVAKHHGPGEMACVQCTASFGTAWVFFSSLVSKWSKWVSSVSFSNLSVQVQNLRSFPKPSAFSGSAKDAKDSLHWPCQDTVTSLLTSCRDGAPAHRISLFHGYLIIWIDMAKLKLQPSSLLSIRSFMLQWEHGNGHQKHAKSACEESWMCDSWWFSCVSGV